MKKKKLKDQCLVFDRKKFNSKKAIKIWLDKNNYEIPKNFKNPIRKYETEYRVRLRYPGIFNKSSFRVKKINPCVKLIKGYLR